MNSNASTSVENMPFEDMVRARTKNWREEYDDANFPRLDDGVTMTMRNRGDYFGYLNSRSRSNSRWRPFTGKGMVTYPIIGRSVRSKVATSCATRVQTECEAVRSLPEKQAGAELGKNILKYTRETLRTKIFESSLSEICQLQRFAFVYNDYHLNGGMIVDVPVTKRVVHKIGDTVYSCANCGLQHTPETLGVKDFADQFKDQDLKESKSETEPDTDIDDSKPQSLEGGVSDERMPAGDDQGKTTREPAVDAEYADPEYQDEEAQKTVEHTKDLACPECKAKSLILDQRARHEMVDSLTGEYESRNTGYLESRIVSPLQIRFDSYNCLGFDYKRAGWFNYHPLVPAYEIVAMAPHLREKLQTGANRWSESARWHFELNNNTSSAHGYSYKAKTYRLDELVEPNIWWVSPQACAGWSEPAGYELPEYKINERGECVETGVLFSIEMNETIEQAFLRQTGDFRGMMLVMWDDEIIGIGNEHFCEKWLGVPWKVDAQSGFPNGEEGLRKLQDAATNVLSMYYSHVRRRSLSPLVVDPLGGFTEASVQNANQPGAIITRQAVSQDTTDRQWSHYLGYLEPGEIGAAVGNFISLIIDIAKEESGVFNETVGNVETNNETLGGRQMALSQSLSLMTPTQQAKAVAFLEQEYIWLELWQKYAPDEAYALIKGTFEEEWKPMDIEAFKALDIRRELFITIVEGTDTPKTQSEMEQRFMIAVNMGLFQDPNPLPLQIRSHIIKSVLGIDFDIGNYSAFKRLASRRYENIKKEVEFLEPNEAFTIQVDPTSGYPSRVLRPEIVASIAQDIRTAPRGTDEHLVFIEFFIDQLNALVGAKEPNEVLVAVVEKQIESHRAFVAATAVQASAVQGIANNTPGQVAAVSNAQTMPQDPNAQPGQSPAPAMAA